MNQGEEDGNVTSRNFRRKLREFLTEWNEDNQRVDNRPRKFSHDPELDLDPEMTGDLPELFKLSGLDPAAPGHWQLLMVAIMNFMSAQERGAKEKWTTKARERFLQEMFELSREYPKKKRLELCAELQKRYKEESLKRTTQGLLYLGAPESLRTKFQAFLKLWRTQGERGELSPKIRRFLQHFT